MHSKRASSINQMKKRLEEKKLLAIKMKKKIWIDNSNANF